MHGTFQTQFWSHEGQTTKNIVDSEDMIVSRAWKIAKACLSDPQVQELMTSPETSTTLLSRSRNGVMEESCVVKCMRYDG